MSSLRRISSFLMILSAAWASPIVAYAFDEDAWRAEEQRSDNEYFYKCLHDFEEKPLEPAAADRTVEAYRMVYLPSFFRQVSMRVNVWPHGGGRMTLRSIPTYCSSRGQPIEEKMYGLSSEDVAAVRRTFAELDFWNRSPFWNASEGQEVTCSDGASLYIEAVREGRYHRIHRSCLWPERVEAVNELFHRLARLKDPHKTDR